MLKARTVTCTQTQTVNKLSHSPPTHTVMCTQTQTVTVTTDTVSTPRASGTGRSRFLGATAGPLEIRRKGLG